MKETYTVANKSAGRVGYTIKELNIRREFMPREVKKNIPLMELEALSQRPGGRSLLLNHLQVQDREAINYLLNYEPPVEYWLTEEKLPEWMTNCSLLEFQDALDFAPAGTKDLIKKYAVTMPLTDTNKIKAVKDQLGYDVAKAIELSHAYDNPEEEVKQVERRVQPTISANGRRAESTIIAPASIEKLPEVKETIFIKEG